MWEKLERNVNLITPLLEALPESESDSLSHSSLQRNPNVGKNGRVDILEKMEETPA